MNPQGRSFALDASGARAFDRGPLREHWKQRVARCCLVSSVVLGSLAPVISAHAAACTPQITITEQVDAQPGYRRLGHRLARRAKYRAVGREPHEQDPGEQLEW